MYQKVSYEYLLLSLLNFQYAAILKEQLSFVCNNVCNHTCMTSKKKEIQNCSAWEIQKRNLVVLTSKLSGTLKVFFPLAHLKNWNLGFISKILCLFEITVEVPIKGFFSPGFHTEKDANQMVKS